jgi:hypothetical protein
MWAYRDFLRRVVAREALDVVAGRGSSLAVWPLPDVGSGKLGAACSRLPK